MLNDFVEVFFYLLYFYIYIYSFIHYYFMFCFSHHQHYLDTMSLLLQLILHSLNFFATNYVICDFFQ